MLYIPSAGKRASLASIRDLVLVYWYYSITDVIQLFSVSTSLTTVFMILQGVGPNLAISFSVYHTVRSYWQLQR